MYPDDDVPDFRLVYTEFFSEGKKLAMKILNALSYVLDCKVSGVAYIQRATSLLREWGGGGGGGEE